MIDIAKFVLIGFSIFIVTTASCSTIQNQQDNAAMVEMVKSGFDPQKVACLMRATGERNAPICTLLTQQHKP